MRGLAVSWVSNAAALWVAAALLGGVSYRGGIVTLAVAGLVFALVNRIVRPIVVILAIPLVIVTLGAALFLVNLLMLLLTSALVSDYEVAGLGSAILATIVVWAVNAAIAAIAPAPLGRR